MSCETLNTDSGLKIICKDYSAIYNQKGGWIEIFHYDTRISACDIKHPRIVDEILCELPTELQVEIRKMLAMPNPNNNGEPDLLDGYETRTVALRFKKYLWRVIEKYGKSIEADLRNTLEVLLINDIFLKYVETTDMEKLIVDAKKQIIIEERNKKAPIVKEFKETETGLEIKLIYPKTEDKLNDKKTR
jgi:hypothetical protein